MLYSKNCIPQFLAGYYSDFHAIVSSQQFPCTFATRALEKDELLFGSAYFSPGQSESLISLFDECVEAIQKANEQVIVLWIEDFTFENLDEDFQKFTVILKELLQASEWPSDKTKDTLSTEWIFWYKNVDFFINVSTKNHKARLSRNLGSAYTLIVQSRSVFDDFKSQKIRDFIRKNVNSYDTVPLCPYTGSHGSAPEIVQFFLGDTISDPYVPLVTHDIEEYARDRNYCYTQKCP